MSSTTIFVLTLTSLICVIKAQYNTSPSYNQDRDRNDQFQRQPYDRDNQSDRNRQNSQYGQDPQNPNYNQNDRNTLQPYDRNQYYNRNNQSQYGRQNYSQYGPQGPHNRDQYYDGNRDQYNREGNRDPNNPYGNNRDQYGDNRDQYGNVNNRDQYGNNRDQYGNNRDQYGNNRDQYGSNRDQYGNNRDQYGNNRDQYGNNRDRYGNNYDQNGRNRDQNDYNRTQYGGNRDQYDRNRDQYDQNRDQYDRNRDQYYTNGNGNRDNDLGSQYGSPLSGDNSDCCQEYCYRKDEQPYVHFGTKTAYQLVFGKANNQHKIPDCNPIQFWSINRHGTKYPDARSIQSLRHLSNIHAEILRNYDERRSFPDKGRLCPEDLDLFRRWRWNETVNEQNANGLTSQGITDLKFLARRYASRFEELMREPYNENTYSFQYSTDSDRAHDSYQAFIEGLFRESYQVHANVFNNDRLIKPTKTCNAWLRRVDQNPETYEEFTRFKQKSEYQQMARDVFKRLGFRYNLNDTILNDMYDLCRYEKAWNLEQPSPWCIVFNKEQLKLLEYAEDLRYFYKSGYGNPLNAQVGCPPLKDLYEKFERTVNNGGTAVQNKVTVFFTESVTIQTFLTAMGIAKDYQPLTANNYYQQQRRQWQTSVIDPFASNVAAVLYQCRSSEKFRVMFFLNEVPVNYPDCSVGLCNWSTVQNKLRIASENCNLEFCDRSSAQVVQLRHAIYFITLIAIFITY